MKCAASHSRDADLSTAVDEVCRRITDELGDSPPDLSFVFVSHEHADGFDELADLVQSKSRSRVLLGCTGETIVGGGEEIESGPALSLWSAVLPGTEVEVFQLDFSRTPDGVICEGFPPGLTEGMTDVRAVFALGDPFSSVPDSMIERLSDDLPGTPLIGGMASGGAGPGGNRLFLNSETIEQGAVGVFLRGGAPVRTVVSQGCRPIGQTFVVTASDENIVIQLGGRPAMQQLRDLLPDLSDRDQRLLQQGLHLGIVMNEFQESFTRGDFLIANVIGARPDDDALAIGNRVRVGQTVQFHVRDAQTAHEDLEQLLVADNQSNVSPPQAGLLFSCNGRGTRLFPEPNHDAGVIQQQCGPIPLAGFFAQGELGPVGCTNHMHGFTASIALFE